MKAIILSCIFIVIVLIYIKKATSASDLREKSERESLEKSGVGASERVALFNQQVDPKKAKRKRGLIILCSIFTILLGGLLIERSRQIDKYVASGYTKIAESTFRKSINEFDVEVKHTKRSGYKSSANRKDELFVTFSQSRNGRSLRSLFCNELEYRKYSNKQAGWFPTDIVELENGYFVGKCFPKAIVEQIKALPIRNENFRSSTNHLLMIPYIDDKYFTLTVTATIQSNQDPIEYIDRLVVYFKTLMQNIT